jgi:hypothetical protein
MTQSAGCMAVTLSNHAGISTGGGSHSLFVSPGDFYQLPPVDKSTRYLLPINQARRQEDLVKEAEGIVSSNKAQRVNNRGYAFLAPAWQQLNPTTIILDQVCGGWYIIQV